jgi:hypothetical protein
VPSGENAQPLILSVCPVSSAATVRQDPAAVLGRAVAVGHVLGAAAGLRETDRLREVLGERHRWHAVRGHLHKLSGDLPAAATAYAEAARRATDVAERDHLVPSGRPRAGQVARDRQPQPVHIPVRQPTGPYKAGTVPTQIHPGPRSTQDRLHDTGPVNTAHEPATGNTFSETTSLTICRCRK